MMFLESSYFFIDGNALRESIFGDHGKEILGSVKKGNFLIKFNSTIDFTTLPTKSGSLKLYKLFMTVLSGSCLRFQRISLESLE
jgi:hypothetical protein